MKINIGNYSLMVELRKHAQQVESLVIDTAKALRMAAEIKETPEFKALRDQAAKIRAMRTA